MPLPVVVAAVPGDGLWYAVAMPWFKWIGDTDEM
jgi:hypothetical protein